MDPAGLVRRGRILRRALTIAVLAIACEAAAQAPRADIKLIERTPGSRLRGVVSTADTTLDFDIRVEDSAARRTAEVKKGPEVLARLTADAETRVPSVELRGMRWTAGSIAVDQRERVGAFTDSPEGRALRELAIHLPEVAPGDEYKTLRLTLLELYAEIARSSPRKPPPFSGRPLPPPAAPIKEDEARCAGVTEDALFDCEDQEGFEPVVPFLDEPSPSVAAPTAQAAPTPQAVLMDHEGGGCYGACGSGCNELTTQCTPAPVRCEAGTPPLPAAMVCAVPKGGATPPLRPKSDLRIGAPPCADALASGRLLVATSASCCFSHDECNRHDSGGAYLKCQMWGLRECGFQAVYGLPPGGWTLKWFTTAGNPVALVELPSEAGMCAQETNPEPVWSEPASIPHDQQQVICPIHGVKH